MILKLRVQTLTGHFHIYWTISSGASVFLFSSGENSFLKLLWSVLSPVDYWIDLIFLVTYQNWGRSTHQDLMCLKAGEVFGSCPAWGGGGWGVDRQMTCQGEVLSGSNRSLEENFHLSIFPFYHFQLVKVAIICINIHLS